MPPKTIGPRRAIAIEIILFLAYAFFSASWMVGSVVTNDMIQEFGVGHVPSSVNNAISAAKIVGNFVAAWILVKLGRRRPSPSPACSPARSSSGRCPRPSRSLFSAGFCWASAGPC